MCIFFILCCVGCVLIFTLITSKLADSCWMAYSSLSLIRKEAGGWEMNLSHRLHQLGEKHSWLRMPTSSELYGFVECI